MENQVRVDKWIWAVRIFKTRSQATEACKKGHVLIDDVPVKPSRHIRLGEIILVKKPPYTRRFRVKLLVNNRMAANLVPDFAEDVTTPEEIALQETHRNMRWISREKGAGRPTKKERRDLDDFFNI